MKLELTMTWRRFERKSDGRPFYSKLSRLGNRYTIAADERGLYTVYLYDADDAEHMAWLWTDDLEIAMPRADTRIREREADRVAGLNLPLPI